MQPQPLNGFVVFNESIETPYPPCPDGSLPSVSHLMDEVRLRETHRNAVQSCLDPRRLADSVFPKQTLHGGVTRQTGQGRTQDTEGSIGYGARVSRPRTHARTQSNIHTSRGPMTVCPLVDNPSVSSACIHIPFKEFHRTCAIQFWANGLPNPNTPSMASSRCHKVRFTPLRSLWTNAITFETEDVVENLCGMGAVDILRAHSGMKGPDDIVLNLPCDMVRVCVEWGNYPTLVRDLRIRCMHGGITRFMLGFRLIILLYQYFQSQKISGIQPNAPPPSLDSLRLMSLYTEDGEHWKMQIATVSDA